MNTLSMDDLERLQELDEDAVTCQEESGAGSGQNSAGEDSGQGGEPIA